jgi:hypothetical protein
MPRFLLLILISLGTFLPTAACSTGIPASLVSTIAPPGTATPDPCSPENLQETVKPINGLMRQFDDYAALASNVVQSQLVQVLPPMQSIRRAAQDEVVPACLDDLKGFQLAYMDATIQTLLAFQKPNPNASALSKGIQMARDSHDQYTIELARLLGVTLIPPAATPAALPTP